MYARVLLLVRWPSSPRKDRDKGARSTDLRWSARAPRSATITMDDLSRPRLHSGARAGRPRLSSSWSRFGSWGCPARIVGAERHLDARKARNLATQGYLGMGIARRPLRAFLPDRTTSTCIEARRCDAGRVPLTTCSVRTRAREAQRTRLTRAQVPVPTYGQAMGWTAHSPRSTPCGHDWHTVRLPEGLGAGREIDTSTARFVNPQAGATSRNPGCEMTCSITTCPGSLRAARRSRGGLDISINRTGPIASRLPQHSLYRINPVPFRSRGLGLGGTYAHLQDIPEHVDLVDVRRPHEH